MASIGIPELIVIVAIVGVWLSVVWPAGRLCGRLGFSPWLGVFAIVPVANIVMLWWLAYARWPVRESQGSR